MGGLRGISRGLVFVKIAILARLLSPSEFGLFGIATLSLAFLEIFTETGINIFLVQEKEKIDKYLDSAWVISIIRGILISGLLFLGSSVISRFFDSENSVNLIRLIAVIPLIRGFINPSIIKFQKNLEFNREFWFRFTLSLVDVSVAITIGLITKNAIALVWGMLASAVLEVSLSFALLKPWPKFILNKIKAKRIINKGKWVTAAGIFNYLFQEGDDIIVGRLMSTASLGLYQVAYKISSLPITEIAQVVIKVTFPVYVKISADKARLKQAFIKSVVAVTALALPLGLILFFFTKPLVIVVLGENWLEVIPVIRLLSGFGVIRALTIITYPLLLSLNKQNYVSIITFVGIVGLAVTIVPLVLAKGIIGAGISALIGASLALPTSIYYVYKALKK